MSYRKARGQTKKLLTTIRELQTLAGRAKAIYQNDRDRYTADKLVPVLDEMFDKCLEASSEYEPDQF